MAIDFSLSPELEEIRGRVRTFVDDVIKPTEQKIHDEQLQQNDRKAYYGELVGMRQKAQGRRHLAAAHARRVGRHGPRPRRSWRWCRPRRRRSSYGPWVLNCQAPDEGNMHTLLHWGTDEQKEKYLRPLCEGTTSVVLRHDRAGGRRLRSDADPDARPYQDGDEWVHQRPQVVHLQRPPGQLRHPHRHAPRTTRTCRRRRTRRSSSTCRATGWNGGARDRDDARPDRPLRDRHRGPARPRVADARRPRPGPPARPVPARARHGWPTACAGSPRPRRRST